MRKAYITTNVFIQSAKITLWIYIEKKPGHAYYQIDLFIQQKRTNYYLSSSTPIHIFKYAHAPPTFKKQNQKPHHSSNTNFKLQYNYTNLILCRRKYLRFLHMQVFRLFRFHISLMQINTTYPCFLLGGFFILYFRVKKGLVPALQTESYRWTKATQSEFKQTLLCSISWKLSYHRKQQGYFHFEEVKHAGFSSYSF